MTDRIVVVGGGIAGLAAGHELHVRGREFIVLEADDRLGGKIDSGPVAGSGLPFDVTSEGTLSGDIGTATDTGEAPRFTIVLARSIL